LGVKSSNQHNKILLKTLNLREIFFLGGGGFYYGYYYYYLKNKYWNSKKNCSRVWFY